MVLFIVGTDYESTKYLSAGQIDLLLLQRPETILKKTVCEGVQGG